mgnify:CR=1 FL=1
MKKVTLSIFTSTIFLLISCGGVKKTQEAINIGNYTNAINNAIKNLSSNKTKKSNQPYVVILEEAFKKNSEREQEQIAFLKKEGNPANLERIFNSYNRLKNIQQRIKPLLPLQITEQRRSADFSFINYDEKIIASKKSLSAYLYANASKLLKNASNKGDFRAAYDDFVYLNEISPDYSDSKQKIEEAHAKGLDYVTVKLVNDTEKIVPKKLEEELLNFNTYGLNDLWTEYHTNPIKSINYDYEMLVVFKAINISPEQIREKQLVKEKQIKDGFTYAVDEDGKEIKDDSGKKVKIDKFKTVKCNFYQFTQSKSVQVTGNVSYLDLQTQQKVNTYPLSSAFVFEHNYANSDGDKRALSNNLVSLLKLAEIPFPSNEQMVYDAGEDLKTHLKNIIKRHKFN